MSFTRLSVRGKEKVKNELGFALMATNLRKYHLKFVKQREEQCKKAYTKSFFRFLCMLFVLKNLFVPGPFIFLDAQSSAVSALEIILNQATEFVVRVNRFNCLLNSSMLFCLNLTRITYKIFIHLISSIGHIIKIIAICCSFSSSISRIRST